MKVKGFYTDNFGRIRPITAYMEESVTVSEPPIAPKDERHALLEKAKKRVEKYHRTLDIKQQDQLLLDAIEKGEYDLWKIQKYIEDQIIEHEKAIENLENMSEEEFMKKGYGIASKEYYITMNLRYINTYKNMLNRIKYYLRLKKETPRLFDYTIKESFKGNVREAKEKLEKFCELNLTKRLA